MERASGPSAVHTQIMDQPPIGNSSGLPLEDRSKSLLGSVVEYRDPLEPVAVED